MAISHWSGRRLVGTWIAGAAGEIVLLALPVVFVATMMAAPWSDWAAGSVRTTEAQIAAVEARKAAFEARAAAVEKVAAIRAAEAAEARVEFRPQVAGERARAVEIAPIRPLRPVRPIRSIRSESRMETLATSPWYAIPMAGALALYVLAIPLGLLAITFVWMIARFTGNPPPRTT